jgi:hypothetical protein
MGTLWEHDGNTLGTKGKSKKNPSPLPLKRKNLDRSQVHAEPPHWLHEISLSKTVAHHFSPTLMAGAEFWGPGTKNLYLT